MKVKELNNGDVVQLHTWEGILSFVLEDFVEVSIQYFFIEKYQFVSDTFAYANASFMIVKGIVLTAVMTVKGVMAMNDSRKLILRNIKQDSF